MLTYRYTAAVWRSVDALDDPHADHPDALDHPDAVWHDAMDQGEYVLLGAGGWVDEPHDTELAAAPTDHVLDPCDDHDHDGTSALACAFVELTRHYRDEGSGWWVGEHTDMPTGDDWSWMMHVDDEDHPELLLDAPALVDAYDAWRRLALHETDPHRPHVYPFDPSPDVLVELARLADPATATRRELLAALDAATVTPGDARTYAVLRDRVGAPVAA